MNCNQWSSYVAEIPDTEFSIENVDLSTLHIRLSCRRMNSPSFRSLPVLT
jgi:hypothetical protein